MITLTFISALSYRAKYCISEKYQINRLFTAEMRQSLYSYRSIHEIIQYLSWLNYCNVYMFSPLFTAIVVLFFLCGHTELGKHGYCCDNLTPFEGQTIVASQFTSKSCVKTIGFLRGPIFCCILAGHRRLKTYRGGVF